MKIQVYAIEPKTAESYSFAREGRAGNPTSLYPLNYRPIRALELPAGLLPGRLREGEDLDELRKFLRREGIAGRVQIRENRGGPGRIWRDTKRQIRTGERDGGGFVVLVREMDV